MARKAVCTLLKYVFPAFHAVVDSMSFFPSSMITSSEGSSVTSDCYQAINNNSDLSTLPEGFKGLIVSRDFDSLMRGRCGWDLGDRYF